MKFNFIRKYFGAYEWKKFTREVRPYGGLLSALSSYPDSILVTGCQRSGTTLVTRLLVQSPEINDIWVSKDDEYDAAMMLSGNYQVKPQGRYCFQTTYLNDAYKEYIDNINLPFQIVWVVRDPYSVVNSMLYNWSVFALNDTYKGCGENYYHNFIQNNNVTRNSLFGLKAVEKACFSYIGKQRQLLELANYFSDDRLLVINYDSITGSPQDSVPMLFNYAGVHYKSEYIELIKSGVKNGNEFKNIKIINDLCMDTYEQVSKLVKNSNSNVFITEESGSSLTA